MGETPPVIPGISELAEIGRGAFSIVYQGYADDLASWVAVKVLGASPDEDARQRRFERERTALTRVAHHPHVVQVLASGQLADGRPHLVMELVTGGSLQDVVRERGPLPSPNAAADFAALASALASAHQMGVTHGDLKPANVLVHPERGLLLTDFGIARLIDHELTTQVFLTPLYSAPEQRFFHQILPASDVFALGATLFTALTGEHPPQPTPAPPPHASEDTETIAAATLREHGIDVEMTALVCSCLARDPAMRPDARSLANLLAAITGPAATQPPHPVQPQHPVQPPRPVRPASPSPPRPLVPAFPAKVGPVSPLGVWPEAATDPLRAEPVPTVAAPVRRRRWPVPVGLVIALVAGAGIVAVLRDDDGVGQGVEATTTPTNQVGDGFATAAEDCLSEAVNATDQLVAVGSRRGTGLTNGAGADECCLSAVNDSCAAGGREAAVFVATDPAEWTRQPIDRAATPDSVDEVAGVTVAAQGLVAVGGSRRDGGAGYEPAAWLAEPGKPWVRTMPLAGAAPGSRSALFDVVAGGSAIVSVGFRIDAGSDESAGLVQVAGPSARAWTSQPLPRDDATTSQRAYAVTFTGSRFIAGGFERIAGETSIAIWSAGADGTGWQRDLSAAGDGFREITALAASGPVVVAVGAATADGGASDNNGLIYRSGDGGRTWAPVTPRELTAPDDQFLYNVSVLDGWFVASGWDTATGCATLCRRAVVWASSDGQIWRPLPLADAGPAAPYQEARSVVSVDGKWLAVGIERTADQHIDGKVWTVDRSGLG